MASDRRNRFPGESQEYRRAREELLRAELELRRRLEDVAALRRRLPLGGEVPEDYVFEEGAEDLGDRETVRPVRLSQLFDAGKESLILYSFMYGPRMAQPCPMCTSLLDGLDGAALHVRQRVNLAVVAKSPLARVREVAAGRGWRHLRVLSSAKNTYNRDYHGETPEGDQSPVLNVFVRRDEKIHHFYSAEALWAASESAQDPRHLDLLWPLWSLLDLVPEGRGSDWYPKLTYGR